MYNVEFSTYMHNTHSSNPHNQRYLSPLLIFLTSYSEHILCYRLHKPHKATSLALIPFVMTQEKCQLPKGLVTIGTPHNCLQLISIYYLSNVDLAHTHPATYLYNPIQYHMEYHISPSKTLSFPWLSNYCTLWLKKKKSQTLQEYQ